MNVSICMRTEVLLAEPESDLKTLLCKIATPNPRQIYVVDKGYHLQGVITSYDLFKKIVPSYMTADLARSITDGGDLMQKQFENAQNLLAKDLMVTEFISLRLNSQLLEVDALIAEKGCHAFPVVDEEGRLLGEITRLDILIRFVDNYLEPGRVKDELVDLSSVSF
ncbi:MAG: CBS domain-containing protein [Desulforhopalus sp.]|jgi:CBS domain-containing protein